MTSKNDPKDTGDRTMANLETLDTIIREPSAVVRKFKLLKTFGNILPDEAKTMSADAIAATLRNHFDNVANFNDCTVVA